jgi:uncharacterized protein
LNYRILGEDDSIVKHQPDITRLHGVFARYADIQAVYLLGSRATGNAHTASDLDLAIVPRDPSTRARKLDLLTDLARHGFCDVDLVFLDTDDIVMRYEAVRLNELVYAAADFDRGALYSSVVRQYLDFLPYLNVQRAAYKRSILSGQG